MSLVDLEEEFQNAIIERSNYEQEIKRAERLLEALRSIFTYEKIKRYEIVAPIKFKCSREEHVEHGIDLIGLRFLHKHKDGSWDYGEDDVGAVSMLKIIFNNVEELINAVKNFREKEREKVKEVKEFLDRVEEALQPILIAKNIKPKP